MGYSIYINGFWSVECDGITDTVRQARQAEKSRGADNVRIGIDDDVAGQRFTLDEFVQLMEDHTALRLRDIT